jgi:hypothetical protein
MNKTKNLKIETIGNVNGLNIDGSDKELGDLERAINIDILIDKTMRIRPDITAVYPALPTIAGWGVTNIFELERENGTKKVYADVRYDDSGTKGKVLGNTNGTTTTNLDLTATWSNLKDGLTVGNAYKPWWTNAGDYAFRFDGTNDNYFFFDTTVHAVGLTAPATDPVLTEQGAGSIDAGTYTVYYVYKADDGDKRLTRSNPSTGVDITVTGGSNSINVDVVASGNADVTHIEIYRTAAGSTVAYLTKTVANTTATANITEADTTLILNTVMISTNNVPYKAKFGRVAGGRLFLANHPGEEDSGGRSWLTWTKIGEYEHYDDGLERFAPFSDGEITGIAGPVQDNLMIFKKNRTWLFNVTALSVMELFSNCGCVAPYSIQEMGAEGGVIWLSAEGVIRYSGGKETNVSKGVINSVIMPYVDADGSADYISAQYFPSSRQYHLILTSRDSNSLIDDQRHLVYHLDSNAWTEYSLKTEGGRQLYLSVASSMTDANGKEILVVGAMEGVNETSTFITQIGCDVNNDFPKEMLDSTGADGTGPLYDYGAIAPDDDMGFYAVEDQSAASDPLALFHVNKAGVKSLIGTYTPADGASKYFINPSIIMDNDYKYIYLFANVQASSFKQELIRISKDGTSSVIATYANVFSGGGMNNIHLMTMDSEGSIFLCMKHKLFQSTTPNTYIYKVTTPGGTPSSALYHTFTDKVVTSMKILSDDMYVMYADGDATSYDVKVGKFTDVTGSASFAELFDPIIAVTGNYIAASGDLQPISSTKIYLTDDGQNNAEQMYVADYVSSWTVSTFATTTQNDFIDLGIDPSGNLVYNDGVVVKKYLTTDLVACTVLDSADYSDLAAMWGHINGNGIQTTSDGHPIMCGTYDSNVYIGDSIGITATETNENVNYRDYIIDQFISAFEEDAEMSLYGTIAEIVFYMEPNYLHKRMRRMSFITDNEYPVGGLVAVMPDANTSDVRHEDGESAVPSRSICRTAFVAPGGETWETYDYFISNNERYKHICDIFGSGYGFKIYLRVGSLVGSKRGTVKISSPTIFYQELRID